MPQRPQGVRNQSSAPANFGSVSEAALDIAGLPSAKPICLGFLPQWKLVSSGKIIIACVYVYIYIYVCVCVYVYGCNICSSIYHPSLVR